MNTILAILTACFLLELSVAAGEHTIVAVAPNLPEAIRQELIKTVGNAMYKSPPGTRITTLQSDPLASIGDVLVPDGSLVLRQKLVAGSIARFKHAAQAATNASGLWVIPRLLDEVGRNWTALGDALVLVGPTLPCDPRIGLNVTTTWPSDGYIMADPNRSPFAVAGRKHLLDGVRVFWVVSDADKVANDTQAAGIRRFWSLYIAQQGGVLVSYSGDVASVFASAAAGRSAPMLDAALDPADAGLVMHSASATGLTVDEAPARVWNQTVTRTVTNVVTVTNYVTLVREMVLPALPPGNSRVAIVWYTAPGQSQHIDLDLYVWIPIDGVELSFQHPASPNGKYLRDIQQAHSMTGGEGGVLWEAVELNGDLLPRFVYINIFSGIGPTEGEVRVNFKGREYRIPFRFPVVAGNRGAGSLDRDHSEQWLRIDLQPVIRTP